MFRTVYRNPGAAFEGVSLQCPPHIMPHPGPTGEFRNASGSFFQSVASWVISCHDSLLGYSMYPCFVQREGVCSHGGQRHLSRVKGESTFVLIVQTLTFYSTLNFKRKGGEREHLFFSLINSTPNKYPTEFPQAHLQADKRFHTHRANCRAF